MDLRNVHSLDFHHVLAVCRQTALLLVHYGVRCAHLHLRHHLDPLPGLAVTCKASAEALAAAYHDVETGHLQDHPNQEAVRRTLVTVSALHPVCLYLQLHIIPSLLSSNAPFDNNSMPRSSACSLQDATTCTGMQSAAVG